MGVKKIIGIILIVAGIALLVLSVLADCIGIGGGGFGLRQTGGTIVGAIMLGVGVFLMLKK